jgi:hypothetical protein
LILATRTPFTLTFSDEERGKYLSVAITWQNEKGGKKTLERYSKYYRSLKLKFLLSAREEILIFYLNFNS